MPGRPRDLAGFFWCLKRRGFGVFGAMRAPRGRLSTRATAGMLAFRQNDACQGDGGAPLGMDDHANLFLFSTLPNSLTV